MATIADQQPHVNHILMNAACNGDTELVLRVLGNAASLEPDKNGYTALHYAAVNGHARLVQGIAARGFKVDAKDNVTNQVLGYTALHLAASRGHVDVVQILLSVSRSINSQDRVHGNSAVHEAAWNGFSQTLHELIAAKANVNAINNAGFSALHLAAQNGHNESSRILLFAGCSPDHKNSYGDTPLHTAARYGHAGVTQILISAKCGVNEPNKNGDTALHIAAAQKQKKITKLLLEAGIDVKMQNNQKETALDIARRKEFDDVVVLISRVQISSPRKQTSRTSESSKAIQHSDKKKWTSIFKKNKSKDKFPTVQTISESVAVNGDEHHGDMSGRVFEPGRHNGPGSVMHEFNYFPRHRTQAGNDTSFASMTMAPGDGARDSNRMVRGILSQYTPIHGVQFYRDLAGNVRQGPVGYVAAADGSEPVSYAPNESVAYSTYGSQYPQQAFHAAGPAHGGGHGYPTMNSESLRHRDHLSYLRNRNAATGLGEMPAYPTTSKGHTRAFCPTYLDQSGRPWPALYPTVAGPSLNPTIFSKPSMRGGMEPDAQSDVSVPANGRRPIYRSRSDETLSTISSRPSFHHHRGRRSEKKSHRKSGRTQQQQQCRAIIEGRPSPANVSGSSNGEQAGVLQNVETTALNGTGSEQLSKYVDSSSNPDSGYGGASMIVPVHPPPAPRSESSSLRSGSSGDVISGGKAPTLGSSCRSDSVVSLCNSL